MSCNLILTFFFFFNDTATTEIYTLSLHDALPILWLPGRSPLLFGPSARQCVRQAVVAFVAGMLKDRSHGLFEEDLCGPGFCPGRRIIDGELIANRVFVRACETLDHMHLLAGALENRLVREVGAVNDQRIAFLAAGMIADPLAYVRRQMGTIVQGDDADPMQHLDKDREVAGTLNDLIRAAVGSRQHWRSVAVHMHAAHRQRLVFDHVSRGTHPLSFRGALGRPTPPLFGP